MSSGFLQEVKDITLYSHGSGHISMIGFHGIGILFHGICISFRCISLHFMNFVTYGA